MSNLIVTGKTAEAHVSSADDGALYAGIFGVGDYILNVGSKLEFEQTSANTIRIYDGDFIMQGRQGRIPYGTTEDVQFSSGSVGYKKITTIAVRYTLADGLESMELVAIDGELSTGTPEPPELTQGNILEGDPVREVGICQITFDGVNIESVAADPDGFKHTNQMSDIQEVLDEVDRKIEGIKSIKVLDVWEVSHADFELMSSQQCRSQGVELNDTTHYDSMINADFLLVTGNKSNERYILNRMYRPQAGFIEFNSCQPRLYLQNGHIGGTIDTRSIGIDANFSVKKITVLETGAALYDDSGEMKWETPTARMLSVTEPMTIISYKYPREE